MPLGYEAHRMVLRQRGMVETSLQAFSPCIANSTCFNAASASGYKLLEDNKEGPPFNKSKSGASSAFNNSNNSLIQLIVPSNFCKSFNVCTEC